MGQDSENDSLTSRVRAGGQVVGSMNSLLDETAREGLPRWATVTVITAWVIGAAFAVIAYLADSSWLAVGLFLGIAALISLGVANAASLMRRR
jgi:hypothetical protein